MYDPSPEKESHLREGKDRKERKGPTTAPLEDNLNQTLDNIMRKDGVTGIATADKQGLCMGARGSLPAASSGFVQSIFESAVKLSFDGEHPVVSIETSKSQILISHSDGYTSAIARSAVS